jgi:hypothetical protein
MPEISRFFGIVIRMFYADDAPPHVHAEFAGNKALFDLRGNVLRGDSGSRTAVRLVREWIDIHSDDLDQDWALARGRQPLRRIAPLD